MENNTIQERVLAFNLATELTSEDLAQVSGGTLSAGTAEQSHKNTAGGQDQTYDYNYD